MFLKKIVISGFKSFADKVVLSFDRGITGIVGPNGSGKSNVIDSVRWVMGEQNAKNLRGEKATDIIFAGSERRKALAMAEVSLVFDNTDDTGFCPPEYRHEPEITLSRRMYADGQREYLINKKPCRLKDIVSFFATTGLGGRSYSMIQQGQVDRILNAKPEDVREIIEEAAGTVVYKRRKQEAEKKLEQTQLNLSRVEDILIEVEKHLNSLENQVEKAREWQDLTDKLREEETSLFAHNYAHFKEQQSTFQNGLEGELATEAETLAQIASFESRRVELQVVLDDADPDIQQLQEKISVVRENITRSQAMMKSAADRLDGGTKRQGALAEELHEDDANLKVLETQVDGARRQVSEAEEQAHALTSAIESFEQEVESANEAAQVYQSRMDDFEDSIRDTERLLEANKFRSEALDRDLDRIRDDKVEEEQRLATLTGEFEQVKVEHAAAAKRAGETQAGLDQEIKEKHDRETSIAQRYARIKEANRRRDDLKERYHESRARYTSLQEIDAGATDVTSSLATLKAEAPETAGLVTGLLTDFIAFDQAADEIPPKARAAIERWCERVVAPDLDSFNELVRLAHQHGTGSMPVCVMSRAEIVDQNAAAAWADAVGAEPLSQYLKVERGSSGSLDVEKVLARLYLLPAIQLGDSELKDLPKGVIAFTSQGVSFAGQDEFVIGGKTAGGLLSRKTELEKLAKDLKVIESDLGRAQAEIDDLEMRINDDRQVVAEIDAKLQRQNKDVLEVMSALQSAQQLLDRKIEMIDAATAALSKLNADEQTKTADKENLAKNRFQLGRELSSARAELETIEAEAQSLVERKEEVRRQHEGKRVELARYQSRAQTLKDGYLNSKAQLELLQNKVSRRYEERSRLEQDLESAKREQAQAAEDIERFVQERDVLQSEWAEKREANAGLIEELRVLENRLRTLRDTQLDLQKTLTEKKLNLERAEIALKMVVEQALERYAIDLAVFKFERDADFNAESKGRSVQRLRARIENMGPINQTALTEFEEKSERRDFIIKQRDEVISSIDLLQAAIAEIEETSVTKFLEVFARINQEFSGLFPILFPTGEGKLELTNAERPLEGGVEILCRLPGKSQKPMSLFSGGEKALTAISLIFALLKTKPTPFCFLDEVDAPLDEANVGRYNRVLEALSSQFQFIVITHNRRTMEVLDTLYGITMQEPGVSKVVGVDMQKDLPPHLRKAFKDEPQKVPSRPEPRELAGATAQ